MHQNAVLILALALVAAGLGLAGWLYGRRSTVDRAQHSFDPPIREAFVEPEQQARILNDLPTPEVLGELDGRAGIPNDVTGVPFPTPAMDGLYESGEQEREDLETHRVQQVRILEIRTRVLDQRAKELRTRSGKLHSGSPEAARLNRQLSLVEENLAARRAAATASDNDHAARLKSVDAATKSQVDRYWAANLRARNRSVSDDLPHLDLDTLVVPEPSEWRARRDLWDTARQEATAGRNGASSGGTLPAVGPEESRDRASQGEVPFAGGPDPREG